MQRDLQTLVRRTAATGRTGPFRSLVALLAIVLLGVVPVAAGAESADEVLGDGDAILSDLVFGSPRVVAGRGISASYEPGVPASAREVVEEVLTELDGLLGFPDDSVQIAVGWRSMASLGTGGPVLVQRSGVYYPAALADTLFGGQHAKGAVDGVVSMGSNQPWYFGRADAVPDGRYDFRTAFTHELIHALGFTVDTKVDAAGRTVLSGRTPQMDRSLRSGGRNLTDLSASAQSRAFANADVWIDVSGGRLLPIHSEGSGVSHFGTATSIHDSEPGALMYAGLVNGIRHPIDAPVIGALARLGYPVVPAPVAPSAVTFDGSVLRWTIDMNSTAPPPATITVRITRRGSVISSTQMPGAVQRFVVPASARSGAMTLIATSTTGATSSTAGPAEAMTMASATSLEELVNATDYQPHYSDVLRLYWAFFNRQPDVGGAKYWVSVRARGASLDSIANAFAGSGEFKARYGRLTDESYLEVIYLNVLGRARDNGGFDYWLGLLQSGRLSRGQVVRWIASAPEFTNAHPY